MKRKLSIVISMILFTTLIINSSSISIGKNDSSINSSINPTINSFPLTEKVQTIINEVNEEMLEEFLTNLVSFSPRYTGTDGCEQAASYIFDQFTINGLEARYQSWNSFGNRYHPKFFSSQNVEGTHPGTDTNNVIIFGAHYDTVQNTPGANDDGSGTTAVLAAAHILSKFSFNHTLKFVTFSGEEIGLIGSWAYAEEAYQNNDNILLMINADMIGRATTVEGGRRMGFSITEDAQWVMNVFQSINMTFHLQTTLRQYTIDRDGRGYSDYFPFTAYGWESIACWQGEADPNMHTEQDDLSNVNFSYLAKTTKFIVGTLAFLADANEMYPQIQFQKPLRQSIYNNGMKIGSINNLKSIVIDDISVIAANNHKDMYPLERVEFYFDDILVSTDTDPPFRWYCDRKSIGNHRLTVISYDHIGQKTTDFVDIFYVNV